MGLSFLCSVLRLFSVFLKGLGFRDHSFVGLVRLWFYDGSVGNLLFMVCSEFLLLVGRLVGWPAGWLAGWLVCCILEGGSLEHKTPSRLV